MYRSPVKQVRSLVLDSGLGSLVPTIGLYTVHTTFTCCIASIAGVDLCLDSLEPVVRSWILESHFVTSFYDWDLMSNLLYDIIVLEMEHCWQGVSWGQALYRYFTCYPSNRQVNNLKPYISSLVSSRVAESEVGKVWRTIRFSRAARVRLMLPLILAARVPPWGSWKQSNVAGLTGHWSYTSMKYIQTGSLVRPIHLQACRLSSAS